MAMAFINVVVAAVAITVILGTVSSSFGIHGLCERPSPELVALELWVKSKADGLESKWTVGV